MTRIAPQRQRAKALCRLSLAVLAALATAVVFPSARAGQATAQPGQEWDGTAPPPDLGLTGAADIREFQVLSGFANDVMTVTITWDPGLFLSYDLDLYLEQRDASGAWVEVDHSTNGQLLVGAAEETVEVSAPAPGTYRTRVVNFASTALAYHGSIAFATFGGGGGGGCGSSAGSGRVTTTGWGAPVKVTPENGFGYEPTLRVDKYGNAFASAHKENWELLLSPDPNSPDGVRSMSWMWLSVDGGQTWGNPPGLTDLSLEDQQFGDEGDLAFDDGGHLYFVDTAVADVTLTRWTINGLDQVRLDHSRPILPSAEAVDDRPWIVAHGMGSVFYFGNDGTMVGDGGRYTVHASYDGGLTFDPIGIVLPDSGWCRPAADHRPGSGLVYAACTNDAGTLYSFVSADDGRSWQRYEIGTYNDADDTQSWPTIEVAPDGTLWVLYVDSNDVGSGGIPNTNRLILFRSTDEGRTWVCADITPVLGRYEYAWLSVSGNGKRLGLGVYYRPNNDSPWFVYAASWPAGGKITKFASVDPDHPVSPADRAEAPADYMHSAFFPDGTLGVVWTRYVLWTDQAALARDIYFSRQH